MFSLIALMSSSFASRDKTTREKPNFSATFAPYKLCTPSCVLACNKTPGNKDFSTYATPRSCTRNASTFAKTQALTRLIKDLNS